MGKSLNVQAHEAIGKQYSRNHASQTNQAVSTSVRTFTTFVKDQYGLQKIENINTRMIQAFISSRLGAGIGVSQLTKDATALRLIATAINKPNIVSRTNVELGINRPMEERYSPKTANPETLSSVRQSLVSRAEMTRAGEDRALVASFDLRSEFGLRSNESIMSRVLTGTDGKMSLEVLGAKGGLRRNLEPQTPSQIRALEQYRQTSKEIGNANGKMIPRDMSSKQQYDHQRYVIRSLGGTKVAGANMHVQRHSYVQQRIAKGDPRIEVARAVGHGRESSTYHYKE
jgi:hypothetical protein